MGIYEDEIDKFVKDTVYERKNSFKTTIKVFFIFGIIGSLFFFSPNLTGNSIVNLDVRDSNWIAAIIFIIAAIIGVFLSLNKN